MTDRATVTARWDRSFDALEPFARRHGHSAVPARHVEDGIRLGNWVHNQRRAYLADRLSLDRQCRLEAQPGWSLHPRADKWPARFRQLEEYVRRHGHAAVMHGNRADGYVMSRWVAQQRHHHRRGTLPAERIRLLEAQPGWAWEPHHAAPSRT